MAFKPMLAGEADVTTLTFPVYASPKIDGIRCSIDGGKALTRSLKEIPNRHVFSLLSDPLLEGFDGELIVGKPNDSQVYRNTTSGVMSRDGEPEFTFYVFDLHNESSVWVDRFATLQARFHYTFIKVLPHVLIQNQDDLDAYEAEVLAQGYEGLILRSPTGRYKFGRSTTKEGLLLKLKRFADSEAEVLEVIEEMQNGNEATVNALGLTERSSHQANKSGKGRMGALRVRDLVSGVEFEIGTGFTASDREAWWTDRSLVAQTIKYKYFPIGVKDKPRHPVFIGFRDKSDMS